MAVLAFGALATRPAEAQFSQLNIIGSVRVFQLVPGPVGNVVIDFLTPANGGVGTVRTSTSPGDQSGVFSALDGTNTVGTNTDFVFGPGGIPPITPIPTPGFLTIGGFVFTATSYGPGNVAGTPLFLSNDGTSTSATLSVRGTVTGPSFVGTRNFVGAYTTQFPGVSIASLVSQVEAGKVINKSISATFLIQQVPEPATVGMFATGLVVLLGAGLRRRGQG